MADLTYADVRRANEILDRMDDLQEFMASIRKQKRIDAGYQKSLDLRSHPAVMEALENAVSADVDILRDELLEMGIEHG